MTFQRWLMGSHRNILSIKITHTHKEEKKSCCAGFFSTLFTIVQEVNQLAVLKRRHLFLSFEASHLTGFPPNARSWPPVPAAQMHLAPGKQHSWAQLVLPAQACQRVSLHTAAPFLQREGWAFMKGCRHGTMSDNLQDSFFVWFKTEFGPPCALRWGTNALILCTLKASENHYH